MVILLLQMVLILALSVGGLSAAEPPGAHRPAAERPDKVTGEPAAAAAATASDGFVDEPAEGGRYGSSEATAYGPYGRVAAAGFHPTYASTGDYRQPVDIAFVDRHCALIPTRASGQLWQLNWNAQDVSRSTLECVVSEPQRSWGQLVVLSERLVAVCEQRAEQVVLFARSDAGWRRQASFDAPGQTHALAWDAPRQMLLATGLWSQQLYRWQARTGSSGDSLGDNNREDGGLGDAAAWRTLPPVDLGMCGGELLVLPKHNLVLICDAFGSNYRLVDRDSGQVIKREKVYGHNIAGLASMYDETMVLFPHQLLSETAHTVRSEITWGGVLSNNLRWLQIDRMRDMSGHDIIRQGRFYPLGTNGDGCGDPSSLAVASHGLLAVTLAGTNRLALVTESDYYFRQLDVGYRPVSCAFSPDEQAVVVVNQFSDSLSLVRLADDRVFHLSLGDMRPLSAVERGEQAFFSARLSHDGWMSCHSCHSQGHTNGQLNDNRTDHSFGSPKRILSLLGQAATSPYGWLGRFDELDSQVAHSIRSTMASDHEVADELVADIAAYLRQLPPPPSRHHARRAIQPPQPRAGRQLFRSLGCADCHQGRWLTSSERYDVGLADEADERSFNPPSLVGVSQRQDVLLHDGRASSIRDLLERHPHQLPRSLSPREVDQLVEYLESL